MRRYIEIVENALTEPNLLTIKNEAKANGVELRLIDVGHTVLIRWIANRGVRGAARAVMVRLCEFADQRDVRLALSVMNGDPDLIAYYEQFGFQIVPNTRHDAEPEMIREPRRLIQIVS